MEVTLVRSTENPTEAIALAAANCYDTQITSQKVIDGIIDHCYKSGHHSIFEFADFHFHIKGISRACSHQLVRHRMASYAQRSQRYVEEDDFDYVIPPAYKRGLRRETGAIEEHSDFNMPLEDYVNMMDNIRKQYYLDVEKEDIKPEDARYVLPNATSTIIDVKMNLRSLMNFMNLRLCTRAQWEIRELANEMAKVVLTKHPELKRFMVPKCEVNNPYNFCTEATSCGRQPLLKDVYNAKSK